MKRKFQFEIYKQNQSFYDNFMAQSETQGEVSAIENDPECKVLMELAGDESNRLRSSGDYSGSIVFVLPGDIGDYKTKNQITPNNDIYVVENGLPIHSLSDRAKLKDSGTFLLDERLRALYDGGKPELDPILVSRLQSFIASVIPDSASTKDFVKGAKAILKKLGIDPDKTTSLRVG